MAKMRASECSAIVFVLLAVSSCLAGVNFAKHSGGDSFPASSVTDWSSIEKLEHALGAATLLPISSQKLFLSKIGEALVEIGEGHCNVFGGADACVPVPESSDYAKLCQNFNQNVDCAFEMEALQGIHQDPDTIMRERLTKDNGNPLCPLCYAALHKFWCAQTVPACGTFDKVVDEILPMISTVVLKKASPVAALQAAMPRILQTISLGLPCKKMCNALTDTCGCGQRATFGEVMESINQHAYGEFNTNMTHSTAKDLFQNIWNTPVCELFSDENIPGYLGVCDVGAKETSCDWCSRKNHPTNIHEQIVAQIAQTVSGMMQGGLQKILMEAGGSKHKNSIGAFNWGQEDSASKKHHSGHTGAALVFLFLVAVVVAVFVIAARLHRDRLSRSQYVDLNSMGYTPPTL